MKEIIKKYGASKIANEIGESVQTVINWASRGIPLNKAVLFCKAVNYEITPHMLYPENYPHADDGLPNDMRCACEDKAAFNPNGDDPRLTSIHV
jgi:hypothetical protein